MAYQYGPGRGGLGFRIQISNGRDSGFRLCLPGHYQ